MPQSRVSLTEHRRRRATSLLLPKAGVSPLTRDPVRDRPRLAIYVRLSLERAGSVSIARQRATLEEYVAQLGGVYDARTDYFEDDDLSAKGTVYRPAAERLLQRVLDDDYDGVVVWEFARFMRTVRETHIACSLMREHAVELYSFEERHLTLYGPGRIALEFAADQAEKELLKISARVAAAKAFLAQHGAAPARAPFGMRKVAVPSPIVGRAEPIYRLEPDDEPRPELGGRSRVELVRQAAATLVAGGTARSVAMAWNEAGYTTSTGAEWPSPSLTRLLRNPLLAGYAVSRGEVVTDGDGHPQLFHVPVFDAEAWADLQAVLVSRKARPRSGVDTPLRGLLRCGRCGATMSRTDPHGKGHYRCSRRQHGGKCEGNTIVAAKTEAFVIEAALTMLADPERLAQVQATATPQATAEREQREQTARRLRGALERLDRDRLLGEYDDADGERRFRKLKADLVDELDQVLAAERTAQRRRRRSTLQPGPGMSVADAYDAATPAQRLTVLSEVIEHVVVLPSKYRTNRKGKLPAFDPSRLAITWQLGEL